MIRCAIRLDASGCLEGFAASGHALEARGAGAEGPGVDLACAAVTTLLRTVSRMLYLHPELRAEGRADRPGEMLLEVGPVPESGREWLRGATDFLLAGLRDVQEEHPQDLEIAITRKGTTNHGT